MRLTICGLYDPFGGCCTFTRVRERGHATVLSTHSPLPAVRNEIMLPMRSGMACLLRLWSCSSICPFTLVRRRLSLNEKDVRIVRMRRNVWTEKDFLFHLEAHYIPRKYPPSDISNGNAAVCPWLSYFLCLLNVA